MDSFVTSYGIPFPPFQDLLQTTNSLIAGSAALALYLQEKGVDPGFTPSDMDIWVEDTLELRSAKYHRPGNKSLFTDFFLQHGFSLLLSFHPKQDEYEPLHNISEILSFVNSEDKEIQVILLKERDLYKYIVENFDLSSCMSWWNAADNQFDTMYPEETLQKQMYYYPTRGVAARETERIKKYQERGFLLLERPCPSLGVRDERTDLSSLDGQTAFDIFAYEDVNAVEFLKASSFHVLLRVGEQFYAFHRDVLHEYFEQHRTHHPNLGGLVDTPHKQTIASEAATLLRFSDYSIAELTLAYPVTMGHQQKSVHLVRFYTTEGWAVGQVDNVVSPLPISLWPHDLEPDIPLYHPDVYWMDG